MPMDPNMKPDDILRLALEREKGSFNFYKEAAGVATHASTKSVLLEMAAEEKKHVERIEAALDTFFYHDN